MSLSETQHAMLALIAEYITREGLPPTQAEIARAFGFRSVRAAQYHLEALERAGRIRREGGRARAIRLVDPIPAISGPAGDMVQVPVLGRVAAGVPIGADADLETAIALDPTLFSPMPDYLLRVQGDSMRDEGILDGDLVGVRRGPQARHGQIVVARIDDEITIKRLALSSDGISLLPCNADYAPIAVPADADFAIEGLYCGLVRPPRSLTR